MNNGQLTINNEQWTINNQQLTMLQNHSRFAIINADDFGYSNNVNQAIIKAHTEGILTSTSLMVTGESFEDAVALAKSHPKLAIGLHLVLVCGKAALLPQQIPDLVDAEGNFSNDAFQAGLRYQFNSAARQQLKLEIRAQLDKFKHTGLQLSHVDGHLHLHSHPVVLSILCELAREFNIKIIRLPAEELIFTLNIDRSNLLIKLVWHWVFSQLRKYGEKLLSSKGIKFSDRVYGLLQTGRMTEAYLLKLIPQIQADLIEIYAHPAMHITQGSKPNSVDASEAELQALLSNKVRLALDTCGLKLTNYNQIF